MNCLCTIALYSLLAISFKGANCQSYCNDITGVIIQAMDSPLNLTTLDFQNIYPNVTYCVWAMVPHSPGSIIEVTVTNTSRLEDPQWGINMVTFIDGYTGLETLLWNGNDSTTVRSSGPMLTLIFPTNTSWQFIYRQVSLCNSGNITVTAGTNGTLLSPNYPEKYPPYLNCSWTLQTSDAASNIIIEVLDSKIEANPSCRFDAVQVYDGPNDSSRSMGSWCGTDTPTVYSSGPYLTLRFETNGFSGDKGFRIKYSLIPASDIQRSCLSSTLNTTYPAGNISRLILSPNYPFKYPANSNCMYTLQANDPSFIVKVVVLDSDIGYSETCLYDKVVAYDGASLNNRVIGRWCRKQTPTLYSSGQFLTLGFTANSATKGKGFRLQYNQASKMELLQYCPNPGAVISAPWNPVNVTSVNYPVGYARNLDCQWTFSTDSEDTVVKVSILNFTAQDISSCANTNLDVYDGNTPNSRLMMELACDLRQPNDYVTNTPTLFSSGQHMTLRLVTGSDVQGFAFRFQYQKTNVSFRVESCQKSNTGGIILTATDSPAFLKSPNYPLQYDSNENCFWVLQAINSSFVIELSVIDSQLEELPSCSFDYVEAYDGVSQYSSVIKRWCGSDEPTIYSTGSAMSLIFSSDRVLNYRGFNLQYRQIPESQVPKSSETKNAIIGGCVGGAVLIAIIVIIIFIVHKSNRRRARNITASSTTIPAYQGQQVYPVAYAPLPYSNYPAPAYQFGPPPAYPGVTPGYNVIPIPASHPQGATVSETPSSKPLPSGIENQGFVPDPKINLANELTLNEI